MSTNRNKSTGLTFLWIPGKKKHQHKGRYDTTNKGNMHPSHQQKKMEPWSLGGSKAHADMIKTDDILGESSGLTSMVPSSIGAAGASATLAHSSHPNGDAPSESVDLELEHDLHNASTLLASEKRNGVRKKTNLVDLNLYHAKSYSCDDLPNIPWDNVQHCSRNVSINLSQLQNLDSIERFDDHNSDDVDATKLSYLDLPKVPFHGGDGVSGTDQVRHSDKGTKKNDEDDCTVKCLYYTLMCCECTIS
ncbi:uncharacterized protein LOC119066599 isoform X1 [Bradysia coprophila]|uniref:uncharacterized protein LOC119066599 isoform X1 n=1 Tax=Bradysia coprophila TaxID=38358 RepID=UPI00187DD322|nr:uncharacterized protein LOC119066599 isoform X1 [Bradysia coprophila]XP_037025051.1 uncharacterized protein LOC119066599 isoform X1 [Bradysia coprophila]XP_037025052.1 uncharacterized protein LOC119066599 isoform X1 [Bradysia coprophila]